MFESFRSFAVVALTLSIIIKDVSGKPPSKIVGGEVTSIRDYPSMVAIKVGGQYHCGGTLITNKQVTAAHCVMQFDSFLDRFTLKTPAFFMHVYAGIEHKSDSSESHRYSVDKVDVHPDFIGTEADKCKNDIAIINLEKSVETSTTQKPISLPTKNTPQGAVGYTVGWGAINTSTRQNAEDLKRLKITVDDTKWCPKIPTQLCGARADNTGICDGDSGSPLIIDNEVVGIVSYSIGCAYPSPDRFTRVYSYLRWINGIVNN